MATTITTTTWTDDSGTPSSPTGDGTTINNARLQDIYAAINEMFAGGTGYETFTFGGLVGSETVGVHPFSAGGTGANTIRVQNTTAGTGNRGSIELGVDGDADSGRLEAYSSTYTETGSAFQSGVALRAMGTGGLSLAAEQATADVRVYARGTTEFLTFNGRDIELQGANPGNYILSGILVDSVNSTQVGTDADTNAKTLHSYTLPASTLSNNGQAIKIVAFGFLAANANTKTIRVKFGGATIGDWDASGAGTSGGAWHIEAIVIRTGAATQKAICSINGRNVSASFTMAAGGTAPGISHQYVAPTNTLTNAQAIVIEGQNGTATANDVICHVSYVELIAGV